MEDEYLPEDAILEEIPSEHAAESEVPAAEEGSPVEAESPVLEEDEFTLHDDTPLMELDELPADDILMEEEPSAEAAEAQPVEAALESPSDELEEFPLEEAEPEAAPIQSAPAEAAPVAAAPDPIAEVPLDSIDDDFVLEDEEVDGGESFPVSPPAVAVEPPAVDPSPASEEFTLDDSAALSALTPHQAPESTHELEENPFEADASASSTDELEFEIEPENEPADDLHGGASNPIAPTMASEPPAAMMPTADSLDELEFEDDAFDLIEPAGSEAASGEAISETIPSPSLEAPPSPIGQAPLSPDVPAVDAPPAASMSSLEEEPLSLAPAAPAYAEVDIDSAEDDEIVELELEDELPTGSSEEAADSSWDFVIEESDAARSHHDFKLDLDSPHEQPHGQG